MIKVQPKEPTSKLPISHAAIRQMTHERVVINNQEKKMDLEDRIYEDEESTFSETVDGLDSYSDSCSEVSSVPVPNFKPPSVPASIRSLRQLGTVLKDFSRFTKNGRSWSVHQFFLQ